jgi:hypothetical protein
VGGYPGENTVQPPTIIRGIELGSGIC